MYLVDLLLAAAAQVVEIGATRDGDNRTFAVHGVGETGNCVGEARSSVHTNTRLLRDSSPGIRHMDRRLFVTGIDDAEVLIRHHVQHRQDMITCQGEDILHPFKLKRFAN